MPTPLIAWGHAKAWDTPDGSCAWGRQFELLPGATMLNASVMLTGVAGIEIDCDGTPAGNIILMGAAETPTDALVPYQDELIVSYCMCEDVEDSIAS